MRFFLEIFQLEAVLNTLMINFPFRMEPLISV